MTSSIAGVASRLGFVLLAAAMLLVGAPTGPAHADCIQTGSVVDCAGPSPGGFNAGAQDNLTVNVQPGANVGTGLVLNNNNVTSNLGTIAVGSSALGIAAGLNNSITSSGIITGGTGSTGISVNSGAVVTNIGNLTVGDTGTGIALTGTGSVLNMGSIGGRSAPASPAPAACGWSGKG